MASAKSIPREFFSISKEIFNNFFSFCVIKVGRVILPPQES